MNTYDLRTQTLSALASLDKRYRKMADWKIQQTLTALKQYKQSSMVCFYVSKQYEVDTKTIIKQELEQKQKHIVVPKVVKDHLRLFEISDLRQDLTKGSFSILEPNDSCPDVDIKDIDCFIIPGICFGKDTTRIGHGYGYYDRLLEKISAPTIGLAYEIQLYPSVPHSATDKKLDIIVTEHAVYPMTY